MVVLLTTIATLPANFVLQVEHVVGVEVVIVLGVASVIVILWGLVVVSVALVMLPRLAHLALEEPPYVTEMGIVVTGSLGQEHVHVTRGMQAVHVNTLTL
jgi:hypothetical protein